MHTRGVGAERNTPKYRLLDKGGVAARNFEQNQTTVVQIILVFCALGRGTKRNGCDTAVVSPCTRVQVPGIQFVDVPSKP